jgi:hypothetical protein
MPPRREWIGRYRRAGGTVALYIPCELRKLMESEHGWRLGDYIMFAQNEGLLIIRKVDRTMILDRSKDDRTRGA